MVLFPHAKINIGLQVVARRPDGFHDINTLFYPLPLCDVLELIPAEKTALHLTGLPVDGTAGDNLCMKAYRILQHDYKLPPVAIHLHKVIPTGGGLGGGSSDASHTLLALNKLFALQCSEQQLMDYAARLGSDCAFFIRSKPALAEGRGEILHPTEVSLQGYCILLVKPPAQVCTAEAYANIIPQQPAQPLQTLVNLPVAEWRGKVCNDFETGVFAQHPELAAIKAALYDKGAIYAAMSGSGATVFGLFSDENTAQQARRATNHVIFAAKLFLHY
ncbi:MAG: 4-(cytidine 5'-diphospho)-2-C-methyl-D-erythritol kinase [Prevotellaceae bacterium]|nr:4-(cytidine 5'-diphospho)-2-C-methyl-D-erythritol kinase [Prevotellaceae bacterium]